MQLLTEKSAQALRKKLSRRASDARKSDWELGEALYLVSVSYSRDNGHSIPVHQAWGYKTYGELVDKETGLGRRHAEYLRLIFEVFGVRLANSFPKEDLLSTCKMRALATLGDQLLNKKTVRKWLKIGAQMTVAALEEKVRQAKVTNQLPTGDAPNAEDVLYQLTFRVTTHEKLAIQAILTQAAQQTGERRQGAVLGRLLKETTPQWKAFVMKAA